MGVCVALSRCRQKDTQDAQEGHKYHGSCPEKLGSALKSLSCDTGNRTNDHNYIKDDAKDQCLFTEVWAAEI